MGEFTNEDCMDVMARYPDKYFDLAIVDPPYGGGCSEHEWDKRERGRFGERFDKYHITPGDEHDAWGGGASTATSHPTIKAGRTGGTWAAKYSGGIFDNDIRHWDIAPTKEYFDELFRVSKNQIIWGGNYFDLPPTRCFIVWHKTNIPLEGFTMSPVEYAWSSFNKNAMMFEHYSSGNKKNPRFHPTQKPVELYEWLLRKFAEPGFKILDTHCGSASSLVACQRMGFDFVGCEIDRTYYTLASERLEKDSRQATIFNI